MTISTLLVWGCSFIVVGKDTLRIGGKETQVSVTRSGESNSSGASSKVVAGLNLCVRRVGTGDLMALDGVDSNPETFEVLIVSLGGGGGVVVDIDFGGVAKGLMVGVDFISADRGCNRSGDRARLNNGDPGSALFGLLMHFLPGVREDPGE